ncbi:MFS transporter [Pseudonocardia dioxanivorans]|uniref:MFS transporter n=1 Tax=Pseudonocardia dioxanivorans TaxID=240495 RepID=UPI000CCFD532|nr:MFS transporter [Pseudonocardia dioxanivorans]
MRALLRNRVYRRLFVAQVVALVGTGLATVAIGLLAYDLAGPRAGEVLGTALTIKMVAYVCVSPLVGAYADRVPRRMLMVGADLVRVAVVLMLPLVDAAWQVYALIAVLQAASATFTPTFQSVLPDILTDEGDYTTALSASQVASSLENIVSPLLAAALLLVVEFSSLFLGTALGFVASALLVVGARVPAARRSERVRLGDRLSAGLRVFAATPRLRAVLALDMVVAASGAITIVSTVNVVRDLLGAAEARVPLLLAVSGAGTVAAAFCAPLLLRWGTERRVLLLGALTTTVAVAGAVTMSRFPSWPAAVGVWALIGFGGGLVMLPIGRVVRSSACEEDRPAVFAAQFSLSHACWLVAYPLAGWVGAVAGFTVAWTVLSALVVVAAVVAVRLWPTGLSPVVRHRHDAEPAHDHSAHPEWDGTSWVHTHHVVIDAHHRRWPQPA